MDQPHRSFVGFGFGPIQSGLFLYEAFRGGQFSGYTIAEVDGELVARIRANHGCYALNIAHRDHIETVTVTGVQMLNPREPADRSKLVDAIARADELATALPSVRFYSGGDASVVSLLGEALGRRSNKPRVLYAAENDNRAAEILTEHLQQSVPESELDHFQALNTVIGKMSGVVDDPATIARLGLKTMTPQSSKAILVERFNHILISRIALRGFHSGITAFEQKNDLLPFEEAKLFGHNAVHALIGYLANERGLQTMDQSAGYPDLMETARRALVDESGQALIRKFAAMNDPLFTVAGWNSYADELIQRMTNPLLNDRVERVIRDPARKLGWDDRLFGAMRLAVSQGIEPVSLARGAAAAVRHHLNRQSINRKLLTQTLTGLWPTDADAACVARLVELTWNAISEGS